MMIHPAPFDSVKLNYLAASTFEVEYFGRSSHPAAPHLGINAADALTVAQTAIALLRQHVQVTDGIQGIVTNGGDAPNIIPAYTSSRYTIRSKSIQAIEKLAPRVHACFKAGAIATGCALRIVEETNHTRRCTMMKILSAFTNATLNRLDDGLWTTPR